jgi:hypothetical protein
VSRNVFGATKKQELLQSGGSEGCVIGNFSIKKRYFIFVRLQSAILSFKWDVSECGFFDRVPSVKSLGIFNNNKIYQLGVLMTVPRYICIVKWKICYTRSLNIISVRRG